MASHRPDPSGSSGTSSPSSLRALELSESFNNNVTDRPNLARQHRSSTVTSLGGFEFQPLPLTLSGEEDSSKGQGEEKHVSLLHGMALIVGTQVGSGIFSSPGVVVAEVGSPGASLCVWVMSAILAWTGASSFAELGCAIPLSGGAQAYLAYAYGPMLSFLYTWTGVSTIKPGGAAIIALIFGEYINRMVYHATTSDEEAIVPEWTFKITAIVVVGMVTVLNLASRSMGTNSSVVITIVKMMSLLFVGVLGIIWLAKNGPGEALSTNIFEGSATLPGNYAIALYSGLWAFDGWDAACFVAGEMKDTRRDLPRALHSSMTIVLLLFVGANVSYFIVLDPKVVASTNTVALDFGRVTLGKFGAVVFSCLVSISCFGALSASFYTTAKLIYAAARDRLLPDAFARLHQRRKTPDNAMFLQAGLTTFFIVFGGGFRILLNFISVACWTFYLLTVLGLLILRVKEPHLERPYRTWLVTPIVFCGVSLFLLLMPIFAAPLEAFAAFVFMATGVPIYYLTANLRTSPREGHSPGGFKATLRDAWYRFSDDVRSVLLGKEAQSRNTVRAADTGEERRGMLGRDTIEMSER